MSYTLYKDITTVNRTLMNNKENKYIVIHYTGNKTDTAKNNASYFKSTNRSASAHYFVDGKSVYQVVEDKDAAWAVGKNYGSNNLFNIVKNSNSISIEMCSDDGSIAYDTFNNTVELTKFIMKKYNIPASNVYRHFDVCSKQCPGWDGWIGANETIWNKFKSLISTTSSTATTNSNSSSTTISILYRVRKTWDNVSSQIGAYHSLENAKASCKEGYSVFGNNGTVVYSKTTGNTVTLNHTEYTYKDFIMEVQTVLGAKVDGIAGSETLSKTVTVSMTKHRKHNVVRPLQKYFNVLGYNCGEVDGIAGVKFDSACRAFQKKHNCIVDGEITAGKNTWRSLLGLR